jgi:hypothetical protein
VETLIETEDTAKNLRYSQYRITPKISVGEDVLSLHPNYVCSSKLMLQHRDSIYIFNPFLLFLTLFFDITFLILNIKF